MSLCQYPAFFNPRFYSGEGINHGASRCGLFSINFFMYLLKAFMAKPLEKYIQLFLLSADRQLSSCHVDTPAANVLLVPKTSIVFGINGNCFIRTLPIVARRYDVVNDELRHFKISIASAIVPDWLTLNKGPVTLTMATSVMFGP